MSAGRRWPRRADGGCAALLVVAARGNDPDLATFVGGAHLGASFVVWPRDRAPSLGFFTEMERDEAASTGLDLLTPAALGLEELLKRGARGAGLWSAVVIAALDKLGVPPSRLAVAGRAPAGTVVELARGLEARGFEPVSGGGLVAELRRRKSAAELAEVRRAAAGVQSAMLRVAELLAATTVRSDRLELGGLPLTAGRLRSEIAGVLAADGLEQPEGNIVAAGRDAGVPHSQGGSERVLEPGVALVVDLYPKGRLFADCTRTFCVGVAPPALARAHETVAEALAAAHAAARPGVECWSLQRRTCERLAAAGYETPISHPGSERGYVHGLGHGVGYELHELPSFREPAGEEAGDVLVSGDVITLEPGLYDPEAGWGVRLEDLCRVSAEGVENLTPLPTALDPRAWHAA